MGTSSNSNSPFETTDRVPQLPCIALGFLVCVCCGPSPKPSASTRIHFMTSGRTYPLYDKWTHVARKTQKRLKVEAQSRFASKTDAEQSGTVDPKPDRSAPQTDQSAPVSVATPPLEDQGALRAKKSPEVLGS